MGERTLCSASVGLVHTGLANRHTNTDMVHPNSYQGQLQVLHTRPTKGCGSGLTQHSG